MITEVHIHDQRIGELSSLACSAQHDRVAWGCNDDPTTPDVFGINTYTGQTVSTIELLGVRLTDTEAIDRYQNLLYLGGIGDNKLNRDWISLFVFPEPKTLGKHTITPDAYRLVYPQRRKYDAETLVVNPRSGHCYILTKEHGRCQIFMLPPTLFQSGYKNELKHVGTVPLSLVTDGSFNAEGTVLALRQKGVKKSIAFLELENLKILPSIKARKLKQPEAVAVEPDSLHLVYSSEGKKQPLVRDDFPPQYR